MSELGDLLELIHGAATSFRTVRAELTWWEATGRKARALADAEEREPERTRGKKWGSTSASFTIDIGDPGDLPEEERGALLILAERPRRYREELPDDESPQLLVRDGELWWTHDAFLGTTTNADDAEPSLSQSYGEFEGLLDPSALPSALTLEPLGPGERAGRTVIRARAIPRSGPASWDRRAVVALGGPGADEYEIEFDASYGVVLLAEARLGGDPFSRVEANQISFDEPLPADAFVFVAPG